MDILTKHTWPIYILVVFLIGIGLTATRTRVLSFRRLLILPTIFTVLNIGWLVERTQEHFSLFIYWVIGLVVGGFFGWLTVLHWRVHPDHHQKTITLPGSWSTLILILLVFFVRYYFVYNYEVHPETAAALFTPDALISGTITGIFIGRSLELYRKYHVAK